MLRVHCPNNNLLRVHCQNNNLLRVHCPNNKLLRVHCPNNNLLRLHCPNNKKHNLPKKYSRMSKTYLAVLRRFFSSQNIVKSTGNRIHGKNICKILHFKIC